MFTWESIKGAIGTAAPMIGSLIGGKGGEMLGGMVASALGVENTPEAVANELKNNPEAMLKIAELESKERVRLNELSINAMQINLDERKAELLDTQNARENHKNHWMPSALVLILAAMVTGMFVSLFVFEPPKEFDQVVIMIAGAVLGAFGTGIAYWLGSSKGSSDKGKIQAAQFKGIK